MLSLLTDDIFALRAINRLNVQISEQLPMEFRPLSACLPLALGPVGPRLKIKRVLASPLRIMPGDTPGISFDGPLALNRFTNIPGNNDILQCRYR